MNVERLEQVLNHRAPPPNPGVVRLVRSAWSDRHGVHQTTRIIWLKRTFAESHNLLEHDAEMIGADALLHAIVNLHSMPPGLYNVVTCNECYDRESGTLDDYDYKLVPLPDK